MKSTMVLKSAAAAFVAAGALATFGADTAVAGRTVSPYAGQFTGPLPDGYSADAWGSIAVSSNGGIVISQPPAGITDGKFTGSVKADGTYEIVTTWNPNKFRWWVTDVLPAPDFAAKSLASGTVTYVVSSGTITLGGDGNLYGSTNAGNTFTWVRQ